MIFSDISKIITPNSEILVLSGYIGNPITSIYNNFFLDYYSKFFKLIFIMYVVQLFNIYISSII